MDNKYEIQSKNIRNLAIIAHVDHGKTTLLDNILKQSGTFHENQIVQERLMDHNALEMERGITILAKCTSVYYSGIKYNFIDTPGHADFGGEVERVLSMVDGAALLVDASEGPMPQTKFVLTKALQIGLSPIVIINKVDRPDSRIDEVINEIFELFITLNATDKQLNFPILYASGRNGWASMQKDVIGSDLKPLFEVIKERVESPAVDVNAPFSMLATLLTLDQYVGRVLIGKVYSGIASVGTQVKGLGLNGKVIENTKLTKLFGFSGIDRIPIDIAVAGDIIAIAGMEKTSVADTICTLTIDKPIESIPVDPPTMAITMSVNDSPLAGTEGKKVTSRSILERLQKETETNVAMSLNISANSENFEVGGRGELQLGILIETMRREGFEISVSRPRVLFKKDEKGNLLEPIEEVFLDIDDQYSGVVVEKLSSRRGEMIDIHHGKNGKTRVVFHIPSRCLIGYQSEFRNDTRGTGVLSKVFLSYQPYKGDIATRRNGVLISNSDGESVAYALWNIEERGTLFIGPKIKVYEGMIIGEHNRENDLDVNPIRGKQLTNIRASGSDENIKLTPHKQITVEEVLSYIKDDEMVEFTPLSIRIRKKALNPNERKKMSRSLKEF